MSQKSITIAMNKAAETIGNLIESKSGSKITSMKNT